MVPQGEIRRGPAARCSTGGRRTDPSDELRSADRTAISNGDDRFSMVRQGKSPDMSAIEIGAQDVSEIVIRRQRPRPRRWPRCPECLHIRLSDKRGDTLATVRGFVNEIELPLTGDVAGHVSDGAA
jgi:hypothetical protein